MTTKKGKAHARHIPLIYPDTVRPPPALPDAASVLKMGLRLTEQELTVIRMAMAIHTTSKQPKLTWTGLSAEDHEAGISRVGGNRMAQPRDRAIRRRSKTMKVFRKPTVEESSVPEQPQKSRFQLILDDLNEAHRRMDHAAHLFGTLIIDIEKGMGFIDKFRNHLTQAIEEGGGAVIESNIEDQIKDFIPKAIERNG